MPGNGNTNGRGGQGNGFTIEFISICKARLRLEELKPRAAPSSARKLLRGRQGSVRVRERGAMALLLADGIECTPELLYTTAEARTVIGCGTTRLYEFLASGKLRARRLGHRTLIEAKSLHEFVNSLPLVATPEMQHRASGGAQTMSPTIPPAPRRSRSRKPQCAPAAVTP